MHLGHLGYHKTKIVWKTIQSFNYFHSNQIKLLDNNKDSKKIYNQELNRLLNL